MKWLFCIALGAASNVAWHWISERTNKHKRDDV